MVVMQEYGVGNQPAPRAPAHVAALLKMRCETSGSSYAMFWQRSTRGGMSTGNMAVEGGWIKDKDPKKKSDLAESGERERKSENKQKDAFTPERDGEKEKQKDREGENKRDEPRKPSSDKESEETKKLISEGQHGSGERNGKSRTGNESGESGRRRESERDKSKEVRKAENESDYRRRGNDDGTRAEDYNDDDKVPKRSGQSKVKFIAFAHSFIHSFIHYFKKGCHHRG